MIIGKLTQNIHLLKIIKGSVNIIYTIIYNIVYTILTDGLQGKWGGGEKKKMLKGGIVKYANRRN